MEYEFNLDLTKALLEVEEIKNIISPKECYGNCFKVSTYSFLKDKFSKGDYKVALCYARVSTIPLWIRHCVIVTNHYDIIDFANVDSNGKWEYKIFKVFEYDEYYDLIAQTLDDETELCRCDFPNLEIEYLAYRELTEKNNQILYNEDSYKGEFFSLVEHDHMTYIYPLLKEHADKYEVSYEKR